MDGIVWIVLAYFIGAIPSGYMIGRVFYGVNLKKVGAAISERRMRIVSWAPSLVFPSLSATF